jgi:pimeloyl-ACP methyl ester carboxylesterase
VSKGKRSSSSSDIPAIQECFATVEGARMRYLRAGKGPPLVLLHGLLGYSFSWRFSMPVLARYATVYAVDMLGAGFSDRPRNIDAGMRAEARRLMQFVDEVGISTFDLLGTSHGGAVAMFAAAMYADQSKRRLERLILVDPVNPWSAHGQTLAPFFGSPIGGAVFGITLARLPILHSYVLGRLYADTKNIPPGTLEGYSAPYQDPSAFEHALAICRNWSADLKELESIMPKIADYPTLLIWGGQDRAVYVSSAERLRGVFKQCELVVIEEAGHLPYEETPDEFNRVLVEFLQSAPRNW